MYATDGQTDGQTNGRTKATLIVPFPTVGAYNNNIVEYKQYMSTLTNGRFLKDYFKDKFLNLR